MKMATKIYYAYECEKCLFASSDIGRVKEHIRRDHITKPEVNKLCQNVEPFTFSKCPGCKYHYQYVGQTSTLVCSHGWHTPLMERHVNKNKIPEVNPWAIWFKK